MISGKWLLAAIPIVASAVTVILGRNRFKAQGAREAKESRDITIKDPVPTVNIKETPEFATKQDLHEVWKAIETNRNHNTEELGKIYNRINTQSEAVATMKGTMNEIKTTVNELLRIAINGKKSS